MKITKKRGLSLFACLMLAAVFALPKFTGAQLADMGDLEGESGLESTEVGDIIVGTVNWLFWAVLFISLIGFVISGIMFITAGGSERADEARKWLTGTIIGIIVALVGIIAMNFIQQWLDGDIYQAT